MPCKKTCQGSPQGSVTVDLCDEQTLVHTIQPTQPGKSLFVLRDGQGRTLLTPPQSKRVWPSLPGDVPPNADSIVHFLRMDYHDTSQEYHYRIELRSQSGALIKVVRDCAYQVDDSKEFCAASTKVLLKRCPEGGRNV